MPRPVDGPARRAAILDEAFTVFAAQGYHALSMRDLARALGATTGVLYHWFDGKQALFEAMLERQVARQVAVALDEIAEMDPSERLPGAARYVEANADDLQRTLVVSLDYHRAHGGGGGPAAALAAYEAALVSGMGLKADTARLFMSAVLGELLQRILDPTRTIARGLLEGLADAQPRSI